MIESVQWKYFLVIILLAVLGFVFSIGPRQKEIKDKKRMEFLISEECKTHPKMTAQDLYKFLHQSAMGSEHAVKNKKSAEDWLKNEIAVMDTTINNNLIDTLNPSGSIVRINLRPYLRLGYNTDKLVDAFVNTANNFSGNKNVLKDYLSITKSMIKRNAISINLAEFDSLSKEMGHKGYPAVHHSKQYEEVYKPAYRVISSEYLQDLLKR